MPVTPGFTLIGIMACILHYTIIANLLNLTIMLRWTVIFLIIALIAGVFGFFGIAAGAASIAKVLFFIFIVLFVISLIFGRRGTTL